MSDTETLNGVVRQALSDLADAATRGVTKRPLSLTDLEAEMRTINDAYASGLDALKAMEAGRG